MNLSNEKIQAILDGAPEGAVYFDGDYYSDISGLAWCGKSLQWYYDCGHSCCGTTLETYREILTLRQEAERLRDVCASQREHLKGTIATLRRQLNECEESLCQHQDLNHVKREAILLSAEKLKQDDYCSGALTTIIDYSDLVEYANTKYPIGGE